MRSRVSLVAAAAIVGAVMWWTWRNQVFALEALTAIAEDLVGIGPSAGALDALAQGDANVAAFLAMLRTCEVGTAGPEGYSVLVGGSHFSGFDDHPRELVTLNIGGRQVKSSAAGAYQFLESTWDDAVSVLRLPNFSPQCQDIAAVWRIRRRGALEALRAGRFVEAVQACSSEWASLPGSPYGQPVHTLEHVLDLYVDAGGRVLS